MTEIEFTGATGTMTWSADGEPNKTPMAMVIKTALTRHSNLKQIYEVTASIRNRPIQQDRLLAMFQRGI